METGTIFIIRFVLNSVDDRIRVMNTGRVFTTKSSPTVGMVGANALIVNQSQIITRPVQKRNFKPAD